MDLTNPAVLRANTSDATAYNDYYWANSTYCDNLGGSLSCSNFTGGSGGRGTFETNAAGVPSFNWTGATYFTMWTNGTKMVSGDRYGLIVTISTDVDASTWSSNLVTPWFAVNAASINMSTLGNGAVLSSLVIK
ncbi:MAG: hypothetical protein L3K19_05365 [Thermoplasmata archaeon]|nr:hypothetical protein [Thermoplasmata archaeon]